MKKSLIIVFVIVLAVSLLGGCKSSAPIATVSPTQEVQATLVPQETSMPEAQPDTETEADKTSAEGDAITYYVNEVYSDQLNRYYTALSEQWNEGKYYENEMSALAAYYYDGNPLENVGFAFADMDNDGNLELIIGAIMGSDVDPAIFEIWTVKDGAPVMLVQSGFRNRYFVEYSEEDGNWLIANEGSNSAANSASHYYYLENGELKVMQAIVFDAMANETNPWFMAYDADWDTSNDTPIDEATAIAVIESHTGHYIVPEFIPYSLYQ